MKLKKVGAFLLAAMVSVGLLAGCGGNAGSNQGADAANSEASGDNAAENEQAPADSMSDDGAASDGTSDETASNDSSGGDSAGDVTIWYYWETEGHQKALDKVISDYNASQDVHREWKNSFGYICCKCKED